MTSDPAILKLDRNQRYFKQSFESYRAKRVPSGKVEAGLAKLKANAGFFKRLEQRFGVPGPILVAIWGLETGFGAGSGNTPVDPFAGNPCARLPALGLLQERADFGPSDHRRAAISRRLR